MIELEKRQANESRSEQFRLNPDRKVQVLDYFSYPVVVIDDLYADPVAVRNAALGLNYERGRFSYPGAEALLWVPGHEICPMMDDIISSILKRPVTVDSLQGITGVAPKARPEQCFQAVRPAPKAVAVSPGNIDLRDIVTFSALASNAQIKNQPHFDRGVGFALLVYLNTEDQCRGGTALYRHLHTDLVANPTNLSPEQLEWIRGLGYKNRAEFRRALLYLSASNTGTEDWEPEWKLERVIEMRFNRLVCYPVSLLHGLFFKPGDFGNTLDTTRLTMNMFLAIVEQKEVDAITNNRSEPT